MRVTRSGHGVQGEPPADGGDQRVPLGPGFASSLRFVTSFAECLVQARQVEAALALLTESVAKMAKEEEKQALWEKAVEVRARFCMTKPIGEVLGVEAELRKQLPREENACVLSDLTRYAMWGVGERGCDDG